VVSRGGVMGQEHREYKRDKARRRSRPTQPLGAGIARHTSSAAIARTSKVMLDDKLSQEEMEVLIKDWLTSRYPATCPYGRSPQMDRL
jgi:DNA mismatch repair ATPase MutL